MDETQVYQKALELLSQEYGTLMGRWKITQAQALGLQEELRTALATIDRLEAMHADVAEAEDAGPEEPEPVVD